MSGLNTDERIPDTPDVPDAGKRGALRTQTTVTVPAPQTVTASAYSDQAALDYATVAQGETISVFGVLAADAGNMTVTAAPTWVVQDSLGYSGYSGPETSTRYTSDPAQAVLAEADVDTSRLPVGNYKVVFTIHYEGADNLPHTRECAFKLYVQPPAAL